MKIALIAQKGGSGKTTITANLAAELHRRGCTTLVVDADPQLSATAWSERAEAEGFDGPPVIHMGKTLHRKLKSVAGDKEFVIIDTPGRLGPVTRAAMSVADVILLVSRPTTVDYDAMTQTFELIDEAESMLGRDLDVRVVVSQMKRDLISRDVVSMMRSDGDCPPVMNAMISDRTAYSVALSLGLGVTEHEPRSKAAREVRALIRELLEEND